MAASTSRAAEPHIGSVVEAIRERGLCGVVFREGLVCIRELGHGPHGEDEDHHGESPDNPSPSPSNRSTGSRSSDWPSSPCRTTCATWRVRGPADKAATGGKEFREAKEERERHFQREAPGMMPKHRRAPWERDPKARGCAAHAEVMTPDATLRRISCEKWEPGHGRWHMNRQVRWRGRYRWPENIGEASERLLRDAFDGHIDRLMGLGDNR
jgi:hypothetical protein